MVTSSDVAQRAGVSRATVSVVLNDARSNVRVSEATKARVRAAAAELGYSPNRNAQALRRQRSGVIGFVPMPSRAWKTPYDLPVQYLLAMYIARAAIRQGLHVVEASAETAMSRSSAELTRFLLDRRVDGVIFHGPGSEEEVQRILDEGLPIVQLMRPQFAVSTPMITVDPSPGIAAAVDHLFEQGHRRIAFLGTSRPHPNDATRLHCFESALCERGILVPDHYLQIRKDYSIADGREGAEVLMALTDRPTAIVAAGDSLALGALHALYAAHIRVPDDVSLISYDDTFVASLYPPLTGIAQPYEEVSERAISLIAARIAGTREQVNAPLHEVLSSRLVVRNSTSVPHEGRTIQR